MQSVWLKAAAGKSTPSWNTSKTTDRTLPAGAALQFKEYQAVPTSIAEEIVAKAKGG